MLNIILSIYQNTMFHRYPGWFKTDLFIGLNYEPLKKDKRLCNYQIETFTQKFFDLAEKNYKNNDFESISDRICNGNNNYLQFYSRLLSINRNEEEYKEFILNEIYALNNEPSKLIPFFIDLSKNLIYPYKTLNEPESKKTLNTVNNFYSFNEEKNYNYFVKNDIVKNNHFENTISNNNLSIQKNYDNRTFNFKSKFSLNQDIKENLTPLQGDYLFDYEEYKQLFLKKCSCQRLSILKGGFVEIENGYQIIVAICKAIDSDLIDDTVIINPPKLKNYLLDTFGWKGHRTNLISVITKFRYHRKFIKADIPKEKYNRNQGFSKPQEELFNAIKFKKS